MREFTKLSHGSIGFSVDQRDLESRRACDRLPLPETWPAIFVDRFEIATRSAFALPAIFVFCEGVVPGATFFAATVFVVGLTAVEETGSGATITRLAARVAAVLVKTCLAATAFVVPFLVADLVDGLAFFLVAAFLVAGAATAGTAVTAGATLAAAELIFFLVP